MFYLGLVCDIEYALNGTTHLGGGGDGPRFSCAALCSLSLSSAVLVGVSPYDSRFSLVLGDRVGSWAWAAPTLN